MGGGGGVSTATPYEVDQKQFQDFLQSGEGAQYAGNYDPTHKYAKVGDSIQAYDPKNVNSDSLGFYTKVGADVSGMMSAFNGWVQGNAQTKTNWKNYSKSVAENEGGQGDNTITEGAAQGQRQQLLGALANAGNPPTTPTPGLGSMGAVMKNGKQIRVGEVIK